MIPELLAQMSTLEERLNSTVRELQLVKRDNTGIRVLFMFSEYIFQRHRSTNCFFFGMRKIRISQSLLSTVDTLILLIRTPQILISLIIMII